MKGFFKRNPIFEFYSDLTVTIRTNMVMVRQKNSINWPYNKLC